MKHFAWTATFLVAVLFFALAACTGADGAANSETSRTYIYLIALGDNGQSGEKIGCDDSVIPVEVEIEPTTAPITAALQTLLGSDDQYYGQSGLYNVFYQSDLSVESIDIENGEAIIRLMGDLQLGGVCDSPRVQAQLEQTALQYETVGSVMITVNGETLESLLSGQ
ncbi:MAG: GerMN domain-containing protein [Candidatus Promineifilaceae bacterium]